MRKFLAMFAFLTCTVAQASTFNYGDFSYEETVEVAFIVEEPAGMILKAIGPNLATDIGALKQTVVWATATQAAQATVPARLIADTVTDEAWTRGHGAGKSMGSYGASGGGERRRLFSGLFRGRLRGARGAGGG